ncbi:MAG: MFS transporter [Elusimicrobia bacterium]|nr:MFS transporter [Elusimicrobiota bacterium]
MFRKFFSLLSIICFLIVTVIPQGVTATNVISAFQNIQNTSLEILSNVPKEVGKIFETNIKEKDVPNVILVYDMHCQPYTQNNIYSIINYIDSNFDINKIFVEGAPGGKVDVSSIKDIDIKTRKNILTGMLSKGYLSGTEMFSYLSQKDNLYGIEDLKLYIQTVKQYVNILPFQKEYLSYIKKSEKDLIKIKRNFYNADMKFFEKLFFEDIDYDSKTIDKIKLFLTEHNITVSLQYPNIDKYLKIKEYEQIDTKNYIKDLQTLVNICKNKLPFNIYSQLINNIKDKYIESQLSQVYASIKQLLSEKEISKYNYIEKIQDKNLMLTSFNIKNFLQEKRELYNNLSKEIFNTDLLLKAISQTKLLYTLKQFVQLKLSYDDASELFSSLDNIKSLLEKSENIKNNKQLLDILNNEYINGYYKNHILRNNIFAKNILKEIKKDTTNIVVIGGFHNELELLLDKNNIKYISVFPNAKSSNYKIYNKIMEDVALLNNCLADPALVSGLSNTKQEEFLISWAQELRQQGFKDSEIIKIINSWAKKHREFFSNENVEQEVKDEKEIETIVTETVLKTNKFSIKGLLIKAKEFLKRDFSAFKTAFRYKYSGDNPNNLDSNTIKNMESNIKYFPFIQFMLGFDLYGSFSTIFMQSNGYGLPFISLVMSLLAPISFMMSGIGGFIGDKFSKRTLIIAAIAVHALGTIAFTLSGLSPVLLIASQILPTIGISLLSLTLSPFLYKSLDNLGQKDSFRDIYGSNLSLFWIIMSVSSLLGGTLAALTSQVTVIAIAAIPDILITIGALLFTHNEKISTSKVEEVEGREKVTKEKKGVKEFVKEFFAPVKKLSTDKKTFSLALLNFVINNMLFVVLCFFLQPTLMTTGMSVGLLAPVYFAGNLMQSLASHLIKKVSFIVENKTVRTVTFVVSAGLFALFVVTGHPIFLISVYVLMNFWQGTSSLTEVSAVYKTLDDNMRSKWLGVRSMFGMIVSTITQISISGLLAIGVSNNILIAAAVSIITGASFIIPKIINRIGNKQSDLVENMDLNIDQIKAVLSAA